MGNCVSTSVLRKGEGASTSERAPEGFGSKLGMDSVRRADIWKVWPRSGGQPTQEYHTLVVFLSWILEETFDECPSFNWSMFGE